LIFNCKQQQEIFNCPS